MQEMGARERERLKELMLSDDGADRPSRTRARKDGPKNDGGVGETGQASRTK